jgi:type IV pilus assembly protein PilF
MLLRNALVGVGLAFALCALAGCSLIKKKDGFNDYKSGGTPTSNFKAEAETPQAASQNEVALAQEYIKTGQNEIALDRLQRAVKLDPSSADAYTMLGFLYEKINRPEQAEANFARSVKLAPNKGDILNNYGAWLCRSGHPTEADPLFRRALGDPFYQTPAAALGNAATCALKAGKPDLAATYNRQMLALDANNLDALQSMAAMQYQRGDYLSARGFIERLFAAGKTTPDMLNLAAQIEDKLGDASTARDYRSRLATEFPQYSTDKR